MKFDTDTLTILGYIAISIGGLKVLKNIIGYSKSGKGFGIIQLYQNFLQFCKNNAPKQERVYVAFGVLCLIGTLYTMFSIPSKSMTNQDPLFFFYQTALMVAVLFTAFPLWPTTLRNDAFVHIFWNIGIFYVPIVCITFFTLLSKFALSQNVIFMLSMIVVAVLIRWQVAVIIIPMGVLVGVKCYEAYSHTVITHTSIDHVEFHILYIYLPILFVLSMFLRPRQEHPKPLKTPTQPRIHRIDQQYADIERAKQEIREKWGVTNTDSSDKESKPKVSKNKSMK